MRVLVTGAGGQLGSDLVPALVERNHEAVPLDRVALDVTDPGAVAAAVAAASPDAIVHLAAWVDVDACEGDPARARAVNAGGTRNVAAAAGDRHLVLVSSDYVFDGTLGRAYSEDDRPNPVQVYGRTKLEAEREAAGARAAVVRSAWLYGAGPAGRARNFVASVLRAAARGPVEVVDDQVGSPTATGDLARALVWVLEGGATGLFHVVNPGAVSRFELARAAVEAAGMDPALVAPVATAAVPRPARRPAYAPLDGAAWAGAGFDRLPPWEDALRRTVPALVG